MSGIIREYVNNVVGVLRFLFCNRGEWIFMSYLDKIYCYLV